MIRKLVVGGLAVATVVKAFEVVPDLRRELRSLKVLRGMGIKGTQTSGQG